MRYNKIELEAPQPRRNQPQKSTKSATCDKKIAFA